MPFLGDALDADSLKHPMSKMGTPLMLASFPAPAFRRYAQLRKATFIGHKGGSDVEKGAGGSHISFRCCASAYVLWRKKHHVLFCMFWSFAACSFWEDVLCLAKGNAKTVISPFRF